MTTETTILIVDDDPHLLNAVEYILESTNFNVLKTNSAKEALKLLNKHAVHLILTDIVMPEMNGYQLFKRVNQNPEWVNIPFLFLSARSLDSDIQFGKELGVDDYLTKPFEYEELVARMEAVMRRGSMFRKGTDSKNGEEAIICELRKIIALPNRSKPTNY